MNIKERIHANNVKQWQVAEKLGITEFTLSRYLRRPEKLSVELINNIDQAIKDIKKGV